MPKDSSNQIPSRANAVNNAAAISNKPTEYHIEGHRGLTLLCQPTGSAAFYFNYSVQYGDRYRSKRYRLGNRDDMLLSQAIAEVERLRPLVRDGLDPQLETVKQKLSLRFEEVAEQRLKRKPVAESTEKEYRQVLRFHVLPYIGDRLIVDIAPADVWAVLDKIEDKGSMTQRRLAHSIMRSTFEFAVDRDYVEHSPMVRIRLGKKPDPRTRILNAEEFGLIWNEIDARLEFSKMTNATGLCLKAILLTGQRRIEVVSADRGQFDGDVWTIPAEQTKSKQEQVLPLAAMARGVFYTAMRDTNTAHIFPAQKFGAVKHVSLGGASHTFKDLARSVGIDDVRLHDCRRTVATRLSEMDIDSRVIKRILNHAPEGVTETHYDHSKLLPQIKAALERWEDWVKAAIA